MINANLLLGGSNMNKVNIRKELASIHEHWSQKIIGEANGQLFKLAKGIGETRWHLHEDQDELFILYKGRLTIQLKDENIELFEDEMFIVPKGVEHCPKADEEAEFLIVGLTITSNRAGGKPNL
jgi:mannose-6-phosphate isomerase-like protein (cupin superfamily)